MLQFLTAGSYDTKTGLFLTAAGKSCSYYWSTIFTKITIAG